MAIRIESGSRSVLEKEWEDALIIVAGKNPYDLAEFGVAQAAKISGGARPVGEKEIPPFINYFGWCTWDGFYSRVSAKGIDQGLTAFEKGGIKPGYLIIDDGWQKTEVDKAFRKVPLGRIVDDVIDMVFDGFESIFNSRETRGTSQPSLSLPSKG